MEAFLSELCALEVPQTLLLYSDEDMGWLYEDAAFSRRWASLLAALISKGGRIIIVHTVSREIGEMLEAIQKWLPLYTSGAIEPYYCPKLRDNVFHRTLFIAKGHSALISDSVGSHTQEALNILISDAAAVRALEIEFEDYFALCKPLVKVFGPRNVEQFRDMLTEFEKADGDMLVMQPAPSHFTMPRAIASAIAASAGSKALFRAFEDAASSLERSLERGFSVTEMIRLPAPERVICGEVDVPLCSLLGLPRLCYTPEEFASHLNCIAELIRKWDNYRVVISEQNTDEVVLWVKEDIGAFMARSAPPAAVFGISEQRITAAFWEHLQGLTNKARSREQTLVRISDYVAALSSAASALAETGLRNEGKQSCAPQK